MTEPGLTFGKVQPLDVDDRRLLFFFFSITRQAANELYELYELVKSFADQMCRFTMKSFSQSASRSLLKRKWKHGDHRTDIFEGMLLDKLTLFGIPGWNATVCNAVFSGQFDM